jgi:6-phosphofructokinase 2
LLFGGLGLGAGTWRHAPEALRWGVAAGAAALLSPGTALAQAADIHRLHAQVPVPQVITVAR